MMNDPRRQHGELERATMAHNIEQMKEDLCMEREKVNQIMAKNMGLRTDIAHRQQGVAALQH